MKTLVVASILQLRREKISERMKLLQDLVPGCSKVGLSGTKRKRKLVCFYVDFELQLNIFVP